MSASRAASGRVYPLKHSQAEAVDPQDNVWLSASAGTGKTQVLSARVLRLLLTKGVEPSQILCLTFTKAGAAEMATRVTDVLANWVRMAPEALFADLTAIGAPTDDATLSRARSLFANVLDCAGGGLRIDTIHAFSQWLLAAFPEEANLAPGSKAMEDRDRDILSHQVLADMLLEWDKAGETDLPGALAMLSIRMGADGAKAWLMRCADAREVWFGQGAWQDDLEPRVRALIGLSAGAGPEQLAQLCSDAEFDVAALSACAAINAQWGTKNGLAAADAAAHWLASGTVSRVRQLDEVQQALFTQKDDPRSLKSLEKIDPAYAENAGRVLLSIRTVRQLQLALNLAEWLTPALRIGRRFALRWDAAKTREGLIDFDDQIRRAAALLGRSDMAEWIRYKLDRQFDHILIDEAQDTNEAQWSIIRALTGDFFTGKGQRDDVLRTIFVVGDYKQAIFRFQGTSPENFEIARKQFSAEMAAAATNADQLRERLSARKLKTLGLGRSFRTAQPVLDFVDAAIGAIGFEAFGLAQKPERHSGDARAGEVVLWAPVPAVGDDAAVDGDGTDSETWISAPERRMADRVAAQIADWLSAGYPLVKGSKRNAGPGDIMVLVRKRRELAGLIVARLHAKGVPVAGVDRLRLGAPLAVKDLMAAIRFAAQPLDDLSLANLLVSPLLGWSQDDLLAHGYRDKHVRLWDHIRESDHPRAAETSDRLRELLRLADFEPPQALLHWVLAGPWQGRKKLVARLGREANDPIDELLNAALNFTSAHTASLQGFIHWFDAGEGELKRESGASEGLVRVMTVHGSKGLQSPIVILADATGNPDSASVRGLTLQDSIIGGDAREIPLPSIKGAEKTAPILMAEEAAKAEERQEHWRLLYVAMTRAEEALFIGGALGKQEDEPAHDSWYARLAPLFDGGMIDDPIFGSRQVSGQRPPAILLEPAQAADHQARALPNWALTPIGPEPRPPRPLAPSSAGEDQAADPPFPADTAENAARRGVLIHSLLERLPDIAPAQRRPRAKAWLAQQEPGWTDAQREEAISAAITVLEDPAFIEIFGPNSLAEIPLAATIGGQVVAGIADRLLVTQDTVTVVDYKTARKPPAQLAQIPATTIRQMAAYAAALGAIYPGRAINAAVLYTQSPVLIALPAELLAAHAPRRE
ncbi:double-strand break repair helicase AddA [Pontixanthobacter sp.]|uniref:double-strand break repair helicase AddA n=1 Tax=Pontixanthobacter sp. TaxID=2792078 RepID=UPI003C7CF037